MKPTKFFHVESLPAVFPNHCNSSGLEYGDLYRTATMVLWRNKSSSFWQRSPVLPWINARTWYRALNGSIKQKERKSSVKICPYLFFRGAAGADAPAPLCFGC